MSATHRKSSAPSPEHAVELFFRGTCAFQPYRPHEKRGELLHIIRLFVGEIVSNRGETVEFLFERLAVKQDGVTLYQLRQPAELMDFFKAMFVEDIIIALKVPLAFYHQCDEASVVVRASPNLVSLGRTIIWSTRRAKSKE